MIGDSLHVRHLRMRCRAPIESPVGMSARIEDALRTSSRPSAWRGRVIVVRHVRVRVREGAPAHQLARAIEREWQRLARSAVEYVRASPDSEVVWFAGQIEARLALIARLATGADVSAWFWRRLLPLDAAVSADEQLLALFAAPWADVRVTDNEQMRFAHMAFAALRSKARVRHIVLALSETELQRLLPLLSAESASRWPLPGMAKTRSTARSTGDERVEGIEQTDEVSAQAGAIARESLRAKALRMAVLAVNEHASEVVESSAPTTDGVTSGWAGLFFVLNLLDHTGDAPTVGETVALLRAIAFWLRVPSDDPIYEVFPELNADEPWPEVSLETVRALRLACVTATRRPLRRILARRGRILVTRTHLTVVFDLTSVRLDVRQAGLDLDPGWLPRLGRVVRFEYE